MRLTGRAMAAIAVVVAAFALYQLYPVLLFKVSEWQRSFNLQLSASLNALKQTPSAGLTLVFISFLYGIFHAVGPGHGKFILTSYLSFEQTKLPQAMKLTLLSALLQGLVAVALVSVIVVLFTLSRSYFNFTLKWVERASFLLMLLFGLYWIYQGKSLFRHSRKRAKIGKILQISTQKQPLVMQPISQHAADCGCGHKHLPSATEIAKAKDWKSQLMLMFSIGLRPCSGAILVLFLAYTLDLYLWGVLSAMVMAVGTGLTLTLFAWLVLVARKKAITIGKWYLTLKNGEKVEQGLKVLVGVVIILFAATLLHSSFLDTSTNLLFKR